MEGEEKEKKEEEEEEKSGKEEEIGKKTATTITATAITATKKNDGSNKIFEHTCNVYIRVISENIVICFKRKICQGVKDNLHLLDAMSSILFFILPY